MVSDINPMTAIITILTANWNSANTDSITPEFKKIYDIPKQQNLTNDYILLYTVSTDRLPPGIGATTDADIIETLRVDIRIKSDSDSHGRKVKDECLRIFHNNVINPDSDFNVLDPYVQVQDLSDRMRKVYRYVFDIKLTSFKRDVVT